MVHAKICSAHFRCEDLVDPATKKRRRKKGAVPSIFAWTKDTNKREKIPDNLARGKVEKERLLQGRNEVYFFVADPVFLRKFLIPDPKSDENFDP